MLGYLGEVESELTLGLLCPHMESIQWTTTGEMISLLRNKLINRHSINNKFDSLFIIEVIYF